MLHDTPAGPQTIEDCANIVLDTVFEQADLTAFVHKVACERIGLHHDIYVGGNETDYAENFHAVGKWTLMDHDPRFSRYWVETSLLWAMILAGATSKLTHYPPEDLRQVTNDDS